jgi:outer membrane protein
MSKRITTSTAKAATATALAALILTGIAMNSAAAQEQSPWMVRVRAVHLDPADKSAPLGGIGAADRITVSDKTIPEVDVSYFFTPNLAAELVLTYPQKHDVYLDGANIGSFKHLPPSLLVQYHFMPEKTLKPYVGAGINYTTLSKVRLLGGAGSLEHDSVGLVLQAGVDYAIDKQWSLNVDIKKAQIRSDVIVGGAAVSRVKVDPLMIGVGVGYRF